MFIVQIFSNLEWREYWRGNNSPNPVIESLRQDFTVEHVRVYEMIGEYRKEPEPTWKTVYERSDT